MEARENHTEGMIKRKIGEPDPGRCEQDGSPEYFGDGGEQRKVERDSERSQKASYGN